MVLNLFSSVEILDLPIPEKIIFYIFIIVGVVALFLFVFNLIFKKSSIKKKKVVSKEMQEKENFELQKNDIENEISLILRSQREDKEVKK